MNSVDKSGVSAILLFGSRARRDNRRGSDTDLLLIAPQSTPRHKSIGPLSMFFYPWEKLADDARNGDLFVCHIVREAKPIFDPQSQLDELRSLFRLRASYALEIQQARQLGWFIDRHAGALTAQMVVRRMTWCIRTILIARLAERGQPRFSPIDLAAAAPGSAAELLAVRHRRRFDGSMRQRFRRFLIEEGGAPPLPDDATLDDYRVFFTRTNNRVALNTISDRLLTSDDRDDYV